jgi:hypothetical protein
MFFELKFFDYRSQMNHDVRRRTDIDFVAGNHFLGTDRATHNRAPLEHQYPQTGPG